MRLQRRPCRHPLASAFGDVVLFQKRISFQLGFDIGNEIEIGHLQQLDRLHQLRRHDQRLTLSHLQLG